MQIDRKVYNAARIWKLYGTWARKGENTPDRPHRLARILEQPETLEVAPEALLRKLAGVTEAKEEAKKKPGKFDIEAWIERHNLAVTRRKGWGEGGILYELETCPFNPEHKRSASITQSSSGALGFRCLHNSCSDHDWHSLRYNLDGEPRRNEMPFPEEEPRSRTRQPGEDDEQFAAGASEDTELDGWPEIQPAAFHGLAGEIVELLKPHTEADPVALLAQFLIMFGNVVTRQPHFRVGAARHGFNLYGVLVGDTSSGRKGTSLSDLKPFFRTAELYWAKNCHSTGLSTGEGLIWAVRDPIYELKPVKEKGRVVDQEEVLADKGVTDKRLLVFETEFSRVLAVMGRESNTLSAVLRQAWDGDDLRLLTKSASAKSTAPHISLIGHITRQELLRHLTSTDGHNGFANRFIWVCVRRSRYLPDGGNLSDQAIAPLAQRLADRAEAAKHVELIVRSPEARPVWETVYSELAEGQPGLLGAVTSRAIPQTMRLACLYALLDGTCTVETQHLEAAVALWRYCEDSARFIFGAGTGNLIGDRILNALRKQNNGLTRAEIRDIFKRNVPSDKIQKALNVLLQLKLAKMTSEKGTTGRPTERWIRF